MASKGMEMAGLFMHEKVYSVGTESTVVEAAQKMVEYQCRSLLVKKADEFCGIITEGDITRKVVAQDRDCRDVSVSEIMSSPIISVPHDEVMPRVFILMRKNNFHHIPVTFKGKIVGMLSSSDFVKYFTAKFGLSTKEQPGS